MNFSRRTLPYVLSTLLLAAAAVGHVVAQTDATTLQFTKEDPDGDATWEGTVSGPFDGSLETILLSADQSEPVWLVAFEGNIDAGDQSFRAHVGGTLDTTTGEVRMTGVVTEGHGLGSAVTWQGQMVDEEASRFEGTIELTPPGE